ncbi:hypothetical protein ICN42_04140 [Polynucleobacter sp. 71A-WALBACH]|uniref:hypothetical protein n=1 Tax=Polynucleobacter sp. 71A-WALBACH TaxID=2689097 RepID=UPI001C0AB366|nr:hypothetical protein [Polynucleobacter sp. 71A-WALBACH]MBU3593283.1 hypothetical protein [Polynucleobacter sp. 71A-WALBACH]
MIGNDHNNLNVRGARRFVLNNLATCTFLFSYFITIVLGNLLFETQISRNFIVDSGYSLIFTFQTIYGAGYWILLLSPFFVVPITVFIVRCSGLSALFRGFGRLKELKKKEYLISIFICYGYIAYAFMAADAWILLVDSDNAVAAVEARFLLRERLGFGPLMVIMSVLPFLSIYCFVRVLRGADRFWFFANFANFILLSFYYFLLNMKWPLILYYCGLLLVLFTYSTKKIYGRLFLAASIIVIAFFVISSFVFRLDGSSSSDANPVSGAIANIEFLAISSINRMAIIYPYYFQVEADEDSVCGGFFEQLKVGPPCRPSTYIYSKIFGFDGFEGRGTAPQPAHITGYVLGGWPLALVLLLMLSFIISVIDSMPLYMGSLGGSLAIYGGLVGYHLSQIPIEGPFIYDHGILWVLLFLMVFPLLRIFSFRN